MSWRMRYDIADKRCGIPKVPDMIQSDPKKGAKDEV